MSRRSILWGVLLCFQYRFVVSCTNAQRVDKHQESQGHPNRGSALFTLSLEDKNGVVYVNVNRCPNITGVPFVDGIQIEKVDFAKNRKIVCEYRAKSSDDIIRAKWRYGDGATVCQKVTDGEFVLTAFGAGVAETRFTIHTDQSTRTITQVQEPCWNGIEQKGDGGMRRFY